MRTYSDVRLSPGTHLLLGRVMAVGLVQPGTVATRSDHYGKQGKTRLQQELNWYYRISSMTKS